MHWKIASYIQDCFSNKAKRRKAIAVLSALSVLVVGVVALQLMQPAITMSSELVCVLEEHAHSENCYAVHVICEQQESEEHAHSEACYSRAMVCGKDAHTHGGECYAQVIEETLAPTAIPTEVPVTEVPVTEVPVTEVPAEEPAPQGEEVTAVPEVTEEVVQATEEAVITEAPVETETPVPLAVAITSEKDLSMLVNETATWQLNTTGAAALSYNVADVVNGVVVVPETGLDPATTSLSWTTSIPGVYHITFSASDGINVVSDTATLAVSDGNMVLGLTTDALYASPTNSPIYHISQSGGAAPVKYQVSVLQNETEILSLTDYEQNIFTVAVQSWEKKSTITVNVKAVDANGTTAEATATLRCSGTLTEPSSEWRSAFQGMELTGEWPKDLLAIAETQIGYTESQDNFVIESDGFYGYTRYGDWWHLPYSDWCAMFVSFCMDNAELPENVFPQESNATRMRRSYESIGLFARSGGDFVPTPGDLIFFDWDGDGKANHVGIVYDVNGSKVVTIEGNHDAEVGKHEYNLTDASIIGYGLINMAYESMLDATATEEPTATPEAETSYYMCEVSEHAHGDECVDAEGNVICEVAEHTHTEECQAAPVESAEPEVTEEPVATEEVIETEEPVVTEEVVETEEPVSTEEVVETEEPVATEEVVETEEPVATEEVVETEEPVATEEVVETEEPVATEEVVETEEPVATEEVTETEEPSVTEEPVVEPTYYCGLEEHAHVETCLDAEGNVICEVAEHAHIEECTVAPEVTEEPVVEPTYYCGLEEHAHVETCLDAEGNIICEVAEHAHTEECTVAPEVTEEPVEEPTYYCGLEEHAHVETCFDTEGNLICEGAEHVHTKECLVEVVLYCAMEEHLHAEECYDEFGTLICELEEHLHSEICTEPQPTRYVYQDRYVYITVDIPEGVTLPFGTELVITPIDQNSDEYANTVNQAKQVTGKRSLEDLVYDISFIYNGQEVEPQGGSVNIRFQLASDVLNSSDMLPEEFDINVVHMKDDYTPELLENNAVIDEDGTVHSVDFSSDSFSTYYVSVNLAGDIDPGTYRGKRFDYNDDYNALINNEEYAKYIVQTSPLGIAGSFHLVAFDTATLKSHTNGNILAQNLYAGSNFGTNQLADELSYVRNYKQINGGSGANPEHILVIGSGHTVELVDNGTAMSIDNVKIDRPYTIIKDRNSNTRPFIDLEYVENQIRGISKNLENGTSKLDEHVITVYDWWMREQEIKTGTKSSGADIAIQQSGGWYVSQNGTFYMNPTINVDKPDGAAYVEIDPDELNKMSRRLDFTGFKGGHNGSLIINVNCKDLDNGKKEINLPQTMLYIDGMPTSASETGEFSNGKVIWNFIDAEGYTINTDTMIGCVIAPGATVNIKSNLNGTVVADNINVLAESHRTDFTGTTRPTSVKDSFKKRVNGKTPKADQNFKFVREKAVFENNTFTSWEHDGEVYNYGEEFHFADMVYTLNDADKTFWYRVYEADPQYQTLKEIGQYTFDSKVILIRVKVKLEKKHVIGMWGGEIKTLKTEISYFTYDRNATMQLDELVLPDKGEPSIGSTKLKKAGPAELIFNNTYTSPDATPTPSPTETPDTPVETPTPAPAPEYTTINVNLKKNVNGLPETGVMKFKFYLEELVVNTDDKGNVTGVSTLPVTNKENIGPDISFEKIQIPHIKIGDFENEVARIKWFRVYEEQNDNTINEKYDISKTQYYVRVDYMDDDINGARVNTVTYYKSTAVDYQGQPKLVNIVAVVDGDGDVVDYELNSADVSIIGSNELIFNNNEKNRNPNPVKIGIDMRKQINGMPVIGNAAGNFPAFQFVMQELKQVETQDSNNNIIVTPTWVDVETKNNTLDPNRRVNGHALYQPEGQGYVDKLATDLIHYDLEYKFQTDVGVHWYRVYEKQTAPVSHNREESNMSVTTSIDPFVFKDNANDPNLTLTNSKEQYYVRVEVTMDADYNLHASTSYYQYPFDVTYDNQGNITTKVDLVANGTEVDTSKLVQVNDPFNQHVFHNKLEQQPAVAVVDPGAVYKKYNSADIDDVNKDKKYTFILEQLIGSEWGQIQTATNTSSSSNAGGEANKDYTKIYGVVKFADLTFNEPGTYWFRIRESQKAIAGVVLDPSEYIMKVEVLNDLETDDQNKVIKDANGVAKYKVTQNFYKVNNDAVYGTTTNTAAVATTSDEAGVMTYSVARSTSNTPTGNKIHAEYTVDVTDSQTNGNTNEQWLLLLYVEYADSSFAQDNVQVNHDQRFNKSFKIEIKAPGATEWRSFTSSGEAYGNAIMAARMELSGPIREGKFEIKLDYESDIPIVITAAKMFRGWPQKEFGGEYVSGNGEITVTPTDPPEPSETDPPEPTETDPPEPSETDAPEPTPTIRPQFVPLVIQGEDGKYTVNDMALVGYPNAAETYNVSFEQRLFNNKDVNQDGKSVDVGIDFYKRIGEVNNIDDPKFRQFEFELYEKNADNTWTKIQTATNTTEAVTTNDGKVKFPVKFDPIRYTVPGVYWYKVVETQANVPGYVLDDSVYYVSVTVTENFNYAVNNYHVNVSESTGVETITVVKKKATNILKTYYGKNGSDTAKGEGYIRFPYEFDTYNGGTLQIKARFGNMTGTGSCTMRMYIDNDSNALNFNNVGTSANEVVENSNKVYKTGEWLKYRIEFDNLNDMTMQLVGIEYQCKVNGEFFSADLSNDGTDDGVTGDTTETEETTTIYTSLFDENGDPIDDALSATSENTLKTFTNTVIKEEHLYDPIDTELKAFKHVNSALYTSNVGTDKFTFDMWSLDGKDGWSKVHSINQNDNGEVIFNTDNTSPGDRTKSHLYYDHTEVGTHWYAVTEDADKKPNSEILYAYSDEVYIYKTEVIKQNGQLFANTVIYTLPYEKTLADSLTLVDGNYVVNESMLTEVSASKAIFHNVKKSENPNKTSINLRFNKRVGSSLYTGDDEFTFVAREYTHDEASGTLSLKQGGHSATATSEKQKIVFENFGNYEKQSGELAKEGETSVYYYKVYEQDPDLLDDKDPVKTLYKFSNEAYLVKVVLSRTDGQLVAKAYYYDWPVTEEQPWQNATVNGFNPADYNATNALYSNNSANENKFEDPKGTVPEFKNISLNSKELPETGGAGTLLYTAGGLLLMAAALLYWYVTRRKRERRYE